MEDTALESIKLIPKQIQQTFEETQKITFPDAYKKTDGVLLAGMGASMYSYHVISSLFKDELKVPLVGVNTYNVPHFTTANMLFIASSYSGSTEEVVHNLKDAHRKGYLCTSVSAGGELATTSQSFGIPHYSFNPINNPSKQPRMGQGYMVFGSVGILSSLGYLKTPVSDSFLPEIEARMGELDKLAKEIVDQVLGQELVFVAADHLSGNAHILRNQTNETGKLFASYALIPELNHHLMEGLKNPKDKKITFIFVDSDLCFSRNLQRFELTKEVVKKNNCKVLSFKAQTKTKLSQFVETLIFGGYLAYYLGRLYNESPNLIPWVDYFKEKLGKMEE